MNLEKTTTRLELNQNPPRYRFMQRNLYFDTYKRVTLKEICLKKLHLKSLNSKNLTPQETCSLFYKNRQIFKTISCVLISSVTKSFVLKSLKTSKAIIFDVKIQGTKLEKVSQFLKRLPSRIQSLHLGIRVKGLYFEEDLTAIAKSIRYFPKLKSFSRSHSFPIQPKENHVLEELKAYRSSVSRLKGLNQIAYCVDRTDQVSFQKAMRRNEDVYHGITILDINLEAMEFATYHQMAGQFHSEEINDNEVFSFDFKAMTDDEKSIYLIVQDEIRHRDKDPMANLNLENDERLRMVDRDFLANCIMCEEMKPFFRFDRFPNLKKLRLYQEFKLYPLGPFVVNGFAALKNLKHLIINLEERPQGSSYVFKGLLKLPLLKKFHFGISFIHNEEWLILLQFLKKQNDLRSLFLDVIHQPASKAHYLQQHFFLESFIRDLENKKSLRSLKIQLDSCSLESLSQSLAQLSMKNQLKTLRFQGLDDPIFPKRKSGKPLEGLREFIKNQKSSLKKLTITLTHVFEESVLLIAQAISNLTNLRKLYLSINDQSMGGIDFFNKYFKDILQREVVLQPKMNLDIGKYIQRLQNLEIFIFDFDIVPPNPSRWFAKLVEALGDLKRLRKIRIRTDSGDQVKLFEAKFVPAIQEWNYIREFNLIFNCKYVPYNPRFSLTYPLLEKTTNRILKKQAMRSDIMF